MNNKCLKRFPRDYFLPGTLMIYKKSGENHMFIVTGTTNDGKINVVFMGAPSNFKTTWIANNVSWNYDFDTSAWEIILPRKKQCSHKIM